MQVKKTINWFTAPSPYKSFKDFWPHYLELHKEPKVLKHHVIGTATGLASGVTTSAATATYSIASDHLMLLPASALVFLATLAGVTYSILIPSHKKYGENKAATLESFKHALWSVRGDFKMCGYHFCGWLDDEFKKHGIKQPEAEIQSH